MLVLLGSWAMIRSAKSNLAAPAGKRRAGARICTVELSDLMRDAG
jgi:hypothetical protein